MTRRLKLIAYEVARKFGLFSLARRFMRNRLRVLAYHGFSVGDALQFRPKLFISPATFRQRLELLRARGYRVISLDEAVSHLRQGRVPAEAVVITIDDGYAATTTIAAPLLREFGFPATVYVTTYHVETQTPVFDLVVGYMLWRTERRDIALVVHTPDNPIKLDLADSTLRQFSTRYVIDAGHAMSSEAERVELCRRLGVACAVPYEEVVEFGDFQLMTPDMIRGLSSDRISVGLHTHRHRFPSDDLSACEVELKDNVERLSRWCDPGTLHFCYPSGIYSQNQWPLLERFGVRSTTTCDIGLVKATDPPHGLQRFLDGEMVSEIEFDAELSGFAELLRGFTAPIRNTFSKQAPL